MVHQPLIPTYLTLHIDSFQKKKKNKNTDCLQSNYILLTHYLDIV